jgi:adenylate cyclase
MPSPSSYDGLPRAYWQEQIERVERLRSKIESRAVAAKGRLVPDDQDLTIGTGRHLTATVLFTDIVAFSSRPAKSADEQELMLRVLNLYFTEMIKIIEDYGGHVEKNTGDGLMAYFERQARGTPGYNSVKRAVACALTMNAANEYLITPVLRASGVAPIEFRTTMDHGEITVARIGAAQRFNANVAIGNIANFAAKALGMVSGGEIGLGAKAWTELPEVWRLTWTKHAEVSTGWTYTDSTNPYPLYLYTGRWSQVL